LHLRTHLEIRTMKMSFFQELYPVFNDQS
jgi:hypothetical protein